MYNNGRTKSHCAGTKYDDDNICDNCPKPPPPIPVMTDEELAKKIKIILSKKA